MKTKKLAILILNYNGKRFLEDCFESLLCQNEENADIYLIDNASSDGSTALMKEKYPSVKILNTGANLGYTGAYNFAHKYFLSHGIRYPYYLFLNNDTVSDRNLSVVLVDIFDTYDQAGIVVPTVVNADMTVSLMGGRFFFLTGTTLGWRNGLMYTKGNNLYRCFWASGCALGIRSDLFEKVGLFPDYFMYYEDVSLSWQVNNAGYDVVVTDKTYVKHFEGGTKKTSGFGELLCEKNRLILYYQNTPLVFFCLFLPLFISLRLGIIFLTSLKQPECFTHKILGLFKGLTSFWRFDGFRGTWRDFRRSVTAMKSLLHTSSDIVCKK